MAKNPTVMDIKTNNSRNGNNTTNPSNSIANGCNKPASENNKTGNKSGGDGDDEGQCNGLSAFNSTIEREIPTPKQLYQKRATGASTNKIIAYASELSNNNLDFIATLDKESAGTWDVNITSKRNKNGTYDKGICQFNSAYSQYRYKNPNWGDYKWQINECWNVYQNAIKRGTIRTTFYAYNQRAKSKQNFYLAEL